jgi:hypothetical protein
MDRLILSGKHGRIGPRLIKTPNLRGGINLRRGKNNDKGINKETSEEIMRERG